MSHKISLTLLIALLWFYPDFASPTAAQEPDSWTSTPGVAHQSASVNFSGLPQAEPFSRLSPQTAIEVPPLIPIPNNLPIPDLPDLEPTLPNRLEDNFAAASALPATPAIVASFSAAIENGSYPPDTHGAVGLNHLMVTLNDRIQVQSRQGNIISSVADTTFWATLGPFRRFIFDPQVSYDLYAHRWIVTECVDAYEATSALLIGVSQTDDPTGTWFLHRVDADPNDLIWCDRPRLGFNKHWIVVQVNMIGLDGVFNRSHIYVFDKTKLYTGILPSFTLFSRSEFGGAQTPALTYDPNLTTLYLLQNWNGNASDGKGYLRLYTIAGAVGAEQMEVQGFISVSDPWAGNPPAGLANFAPQLGSPHKINTNDARILSVVYRNGSIWATQTVFLPAGAATRSSVQWWQIAPNRTVIQHGRVDDSTGKNFYAFPSIAVNKNNDLLIGYSRFSASQYASANYAFRLGSDPPNMLRGDLVLKPGEAPYVRFDSKGHNRWGDYSNTIVDPLNDLDMWTIQEYATIPSQSFGRWGTWWGRLVIQARQVYLPLLVRHPEMAQN